jgi:hypothetical protein
LPLRLSVAELAPVVTVRTLSWTDSWSQLSPEEALTEGASVVIVTVSVPPSAGKASAPGLTRTEYVGVGVGSG